MWRWRKNLEEVKEVLEDLEEAGEETLLSVSPAHSPAV